MIVELRYPFGFRPKVKFRFDNYSWLKVCEILGIEFHEMEKLKDVQLIPVWMYAAYLSERSYRYKKPLYGYTHIEKMYRWYYVNDIETLQEMQNAMMTTKILGKTMQEWGNAGEKKKQQ